MASEESGIKISGMKSKRQNNKFKNIVTDIYYRLSALPMLFLLWLLLFVWRRRIEKYQFRLLQSREKVDYIWYLSQQLEGKKFEIQQKKLKRFEKDFLYLEENLRKDTERYERQKELFEKYLGKVLDPNIGE